MKRLPVLVATALVALTGLAIAPASADPARTAQWYLSALNVPKAWQITRGAGVTVCMLDSGIDAQVPDLRGAVTARKQFTKYVNADGLYTSHGTGVASVLAGRGTGPGHSQGVLGIAPEAKLLDAVVGDADNNVDQQTADALHWCVDNGASVINMSFAVLSDGPIRAAIAFAEAKNVVLVAASSNTFEHLNTQALPNPAGLPGVLAVTGIDKDLKHDPQAFVSSVGKPVSMAAPFSTVAGSNDVCADDGLAVADVRTAVAQGQPYLFNACGTSYSSPIVAGAAALIRAAHPRMSADDVIAALLATATPAGTGRPNRTYGWGIVNVAAAVTAHLAHSTGNPLITGKVPTPVVSTSAAGTTTPANTSTAGSLATIGPARATSPAASATATASVRTHSSSNILWWIALVVVVGGGAAAFTRSRRRRV